MSNALNEAILEAKKLREVAEANAKKALIEAMTPKVRELIEKELLGESVDETDDDIIESAISSLGEADDGCDVGCDPEDKKQGKKKDDEKEVITDNEHCLDEGEDPLVLSKESAEFLTALLEEPKVKNLALEARVTKAKKRLGVIREFLSTSARKDPKAKVLVTSMLTNLVRETRSLENDVIRIAEKEQKGRKAALTSELKRIRKEIVEMTGRSKRKLKEGSVGDEMYEIDLKELDEPEMPPMGDAPEDGDLPPVGDELSMDDGALDDEAGGSVEIPMDLAQELLAALEGEVGGDEEGGDELPPMLPDEGDEGGEEGDAGGEEEEEEISDDDVVEIDESVLRRELARMKNERRIREGKGSSHTVHDASVLDDFGGGTVDREVFVDSDDSDLNVLEVKRLRKQLQSESRKNRALRRSVESFKQATTKLKEQLEQLNLFNAKLLYVNKLMTNEGVTARQKKAIIESLEKARTLREVKLLYKTLSASLQKGRKDAVPMNESTVRKTASASRPVKGGGTTSSAADDTQLDRWSILAGIPKDAK
jgi:hypothetical protein